MLLPRGVFSQGFPILLIAKRLPSFTKHNPVNNTAGAIVIIISNHHNSNFPGGSDVEELGQEDSLEKEVATHSSFLAWEFPRTEVPGRLQSVGLQRVGHDWVTHTTIAGTMQQVYRVSGTKLVICTC